MQCLDRLAPGTQTLDAASYEVIVTDDGREVTAEAMVRDRYPWAKWVAAPRLGPAANRNNGAKHASGEWLVFIDDDCQPDSDLLSAYAEAVRQISDRSCKDSGRSIAALEGAIHPVGNTQQDFAECPMNVTGGRFWSANIAIQRAMFEAIGGFDANYFLAAHEDQDMQIRLQAVTEIQFVPEAKVFHPVRIPSLRKSILGIAKKARNWAYHVNKHQLVDQSGGSLKFTTKGYKFYCSQTIKSLLQFHFKQACFSLTYLIIGLPMNWFYIIKIAREKLYLAEVK